MASFIGRSGYHLFFSEEDKGVIVDSRVSAVVASGSVESLQSSREWGGGEFSELDEEAAALALSQLDIPVPEPVDRLYTIPRGVQKAAALGLKAFANRERKSVTPGDLANARTLVAGGQIDVRQLSHIATYLNGPYLEPEGATKYLLNGGDAGRKWVRSIIDNAPREVVEPHVDWLAIEDILNDDPEASPEFIARVQKDGSGIDRLYRVDLDGKSYVWDGNAWSNLGLIEGNRDIWGYDRVLDDDQDTAENSDVTHVLIDPESAIQIAEAFSVDPFQNVFVEDLNPIEFTLAEKAINEIDWNVLDYTLTAAGGTPGDGIYTPEERSENAGKQIRDGRGQFAKVGGRVMINSDPSVTGKITRVDPVNGTVEVSLESGGSTVVPAKQVEGVGQFTATIPGRPVEVPRVDFSGILAEPRTPINREKAQLPGTLPRMTANDLHQVINNFPAWVKSQREQFKAASSPGNVAVQKKNSLDTGKMGAKIKAETGRTLETDAYANPLLSEWLRKKNAQGKTPNSLWYNPITAAGEIGDGEITPDNSDVEPIYLALVSPDDPRAVLNLVSLVPASGDSNQPMTYKREDGQWVRDTQTLMALNSATPPPVVPLDATTLNDVLTQVDGSQGADDEATEENQFLGESDVPGTEPTEAAPAGEAPVEEEAEPAPVAASATPDLGLMVLWGPRKDFMDQALVAAGGLDRNRGNAEKLREYWLHGAGAAKIRWNTPGDWTRCVRQLGKYLGPRAKGYCALRHKEATGLWTGDKKHRQMFNVTTGGKTYSTTMVASTERVMQASMLTVKAEIAKQRMQGLTAAGMKSIHVYDTETRQGLTAAANAVVDVQPQGGAFFIPLALPEGISSGDGRFVEKYAATIRNLPISLLWQIKTDDGHKGSVVVGRIERLGRTPLGIGAGFGHFDTGVFGREAERMVRAGFLRFVSADMDNFEADEEEAANDDKQKTVKQKRLKIDQARVMAVTIVAKPAFQEATIQIVPDAVIEEEEVIPDGIYVDGTNPLEEAALVACGYVASSIPLAPPSSWFENPKLSAPTPLTVDDSGHVFGHIAAWGMDHIGMAGNTKPPHSKSDYAYFHTGVVRTEEGTDVPVGQLTLAGGHAGLEASARQAVKHYDDTASAVADIHAGEDEFGIWVAGSLRPGVAPEQIRALRAAAPSGDWRPIRNRLELVAVCQVNVPGFPVARTLVAGGQVKALVAAGALELAKLKGDPVQELADRLAKVEEFSQTELAVRASAVRERFTQSRAQHDAELSARAEAVLARMSQFGYVSAKARKEASDKGQALEDGSFPDSQRS